MGSNGIYVSRQWRIVKPDIDELEYQQLQIPTRICAAFQGKMMQCSNIDLLRFVEVQSPLSMFASLEHRRLSYKKRQQKAYLNRVLSIPLSQPT